MSQQPPWVSKFLDGWAGLQLIFLAVLPAIVSFLGLVVIVMKSDAHFLGLAKGELLTLEVTLGAAGGITIGKNLLQTGAARIHADPRTDSTMPGLGPVTKAQVSSLEDSDPTTPKPPQKGSG